MSDLTVKFIRAGIIYLLFAGLLGMHMAAGAPFFSTFMPSHTHINLLGWMNMMIFGVAYHILPRFSGKPLYSEKLGYWHFYLANIGLIGMVTGFALIPFNKANPTLLIFSFVSYIAIVLFAINMFKTVRSSTEMMKEMANKGDSQEGNFTPPCEK